MRTRFSLLYCLPFLLSILFTSGGCAVVTEVGNDYDETATFRSYVTYAWYTPEPPREERVNVTAYSQELDRQIRAAVESGLVKAGMVPETVNPAIYVAYDIALGPDAAPPGVELAPGFGYGFGYQFGYRYNYNTADFPNYRRIDNLSAGTIVVDIIDATSNELVWRGWAEAAIDPATVDSDKLNRVIATILAQYPPIIGTSY